MHSGRLSDFRVTFMVVSRYSYNFLEVFFLFFLGGGEGRGGEGGFSKEHHEKC